MGPPPYSTCSLTVPSIPANSTRLTQTAYSGTPTVQSTSEKFGQRPLTCPSPFFPPPPLPSAVPAPLSPPPSFFAGIPQPPPAVGADANEVNEENEAPALPVELPNDNTGPAAVDPLSLAPAPDSPKPAVAPAPRGDGVVVEPNPPNDKGAAPPPMAEVPAVPNDCGISRGGR